MFVVIKPYPSPYYPWEAKTENYSNVFASVEAAKDFMTARFGKCTFKVNDKTKQKEG